MKRRKIQIILLSLAFAGLSSFTLTNLATKYTAKVEKSEIIWTGRKVGGEHNGTVKLKSGSFEVADNLIKTGTFVIDMTSVEVTDTDSKKLLDHIKSPDFFNVEKFKESKLVITGSKLDGNHMVVTGNMTILGVTNPITFNVYSLAKTDNFLIYTATIVIDRTKYGIVYKSSAVGDTFIKDEFDLKIKLTGEKNS